MTQPDAVDSMAPLHVAQFEQELEKRLRNAEGAYRGAITNRDEAAARLARCESLVSEAVAVRDEIATLYKTWQALREPKKP